VPHSWQVVVIAAGYDTRAYRLSRPGVKFYEIDLPHASRNKQELVRSLLPANKVRAVRWRGMPDTEFAVALQSSQAFRNVISACSHRKHVIVWNDLHG
jgi:O-methyltransferase involved in polyketide biosynthesis